MNAMRGAIHLGRVGETAIDIHVTFIPVLIWAACLGLVQYGGLDGAAFGVTAIILLFGCVLVHELAHTLYALSTGVFVDYIILLPIGGLTSLDTFAIKPGDEVRMALVGPLANLVLGALLGLGLLGAGMVQHMDLTTLSNQALAQPSLLGILVYLTVANLMLAVFNLLPAIPLDGGRALRALLSRRMSFEEATHRAAIAGRSIGAGLVSMGGVLMLLGEWYYGVALGLVGLALYGSATYEDRVVQQHAALNAWTVAEVLNREALTLAPHEMLSLALDSLVRGQVVPVVVGSGPLRIIGLLTANELRQAARAGETTRLSAAHVMRTRFPSVRSSDPLWVAYEKLLRSHLYAIPVVSQNVYSGLITLADIRRTVRNSRLP